MAVSKPLLTEFGIHHRLESCVPFFFVPQVLAKEPLVMREICNVVHRTVLTRPDSPAVQASALQVLQLVLICATEKLEMAKRRMLTQELGVPANKQPPRDSDEYRRVWPLTQFFSVSFL